MNFSILASANQIYKDNNYVNEFYLPLKYKFDDIKIPISSGVDANKRVFVIIKVLVGNEKKVIYIYQKDLLIMGFVSGGIFKANFLTTDLYNLLEQFVHKKHIFLDKKQLDCITQKYDGKRMDLYSHVKWYAAINIQRNWIKSTGNPKYKYCHIYRINKLIYETKDHILYNKFLGDTYKDYYYKYQFNRVMISIKKYFLKSKNNNK